LQKPTDVSNVPTASVIGDVGAVSQKDVVFILAAVKT
jgi:hypothetical protein